MTQSKQASAMASERDSVSGIETLIEAWARAWSAHDMPAAARLVVDDVDFVTVAGRWLRGRAEFLRHHQDIHERQMRHTTWVTVGYSPRPLRDDLVLAHHEWTITGEVDSHGTSQPPRSGIFTWVATRTGATWQIAAAHNTNLRVDTSHRLTRGGPV